MIKGSPEAEQSAIQVLESALAPDVGDHLHKGPNTKGASVGW